MQLANKKIIESLIETFVMSIDSSTMSFSEQVEYLKEKVYATIKTLDLDVEGIDIDELIKNNVVVKEKGALIFETKGFKPWLDVARINIDWKFYNRYEKYLLKKKKTKWKNLIKS